MSEKGGKGTATVSWWQYSWINGEFLLQHFLDHFRDLYNWSISNVTDVQSQCSCSWSQWNTSSDGFPKTQTLQHIQKDMLKVVAFCLDLTSHPPAFWAHPFVAGQTPCISGTKPYPLAHLPMAGQPQQGCESYKFLASTPPLRTWNSSCWSKVREVRSLDSFTPQ